MQSPGPQERVSGRSGLGSTLAAPPRRVPGVFWLAELLPFRWWYVWTLFVVAVAPIAVWLKEPMAFAVAAVLTLVGWVLASTAAAGAARVLKRS